jgi:predicted PurR-regulated permease PerM
MTVSIIIVFAILAVAMLVLVLVGYYLIVKLTKRVNELTVLSASLVKSKADQDALNEMLSARMETYGERINSLLENMHKVENSILSIKSASATVSIIRKQKSLIDRVFSR